MKLSRFFRRAHYLFFLMYSVLLAGGLIASVSAQNINFPDANFKQALIDAGLDTGMDGEISRAEAGAVTGLLDVSNKSISDLTGIGYFFNLMDLRCNNNLLMSLDVSELTSLENLACAINSLTSLNLSGLTNLKKLNCYSNELTSLDVSGLTSLENLSCFKNSLTSLDVSGLANLEYLYSYNSSLYTIDIRNTPNLDYLDVMFNPDLECIVMDDITDLPGTTRVDFGFNNFTTEPCFGSFEGLSILVDKMNLPFATEAALLATLKVAEEACTAGNKWLVLSSLTTFALMVSRAQQLGRLTAAEVSQLLEAAGILKDGIRSGQMDCSKGTPSKKLAGTAPGTQSPVTVHPGSQGIHVSPELRIYPNPTDGRVDFSRTVDQVEVYDMVGQMMTNAKNTSHLNLHAYQAGVYVIRLIDDSGEGSVHRVVKK